jgi:hypothetical protein
MRLEEILEEAVFVGQDDLKDFVSSLEDRLKRLFGLTASHEKIKTNIHKPERNIQSISMRSGKFGTVNLWVTAGKLTMISIGGKRVKVDKKLDAEAAAKLIRKYA